MRALVLVTGFWLTVGGMYAAAAHAAEPYFTDAKETTRQQTLDEKYAAERDVVNAPAELQPCVTCILARPLPLEVRNSAVERVPGAIPTAQRGETGIQSPEVISQPLSPNVQVTQKIPGLAPAVPR